MSRPTDANHGDDPTMETMTKRRKKPAIAAALACAIAIAATPVRTEPARDEIEGIIRDYLASHPDEVGDIVKGYLIKHPEVLREVLVEVLRRSKSAAKARTDTGADTDAKTAGHSAAIRSNAPLLFQSAHQVTLGNPDGDVTLVEFFDYSCGYCKRGLADMVALIEEDRRLKIVLKEFPILGQGSADAARVSVAVRMQDPDGSRYLAFHRKLLASPGPASAEKALAVAREQGLDMARLADDMKSDEARATIEESHTLARALGINGTPGYVIADSIIPGAIGVDGLRSRIAAARAHSD